MRFNEITQRIEELRNKNVYDIGLAQEVFSYRRENIYQNHFLVEHRGPMPGTRWKVEHITGPSDALFVSNCKEHAAALDNCHLFVRMIMRGSYHIWPKAQATDHQVLTNDHLSLNAWLELFDRDPTPVRVLRL
jgi:hypothetical protein